MPLAIEQAGAYMAQAGATPAEYLDLLARYPAAMYQAAPEGGDAARTIARIWHVTLDRLRRRPAGRAGAADPGLVRPRRHPPEAVGRAGRPARGAGAVACLIICVSGGR